MSGPQVIYVSMGRAFLLWVAHSCFKNYKKLSCRRDRAMLRVIEYFAKSLDVIRNDTVE